jgi:hypothetical protein
VAGLKSEKRPRSIVVSVRMSKSEFDILVAAAGPTTAISTYLRRTGLQMAAAGGMQ